METFKVKVQVTSAIQITVRAESAEEALAHVYQMDPDQIIDSGYFLSCDVTDGEIV